MTNLPIKRALISVSDKTGLIDRAKKLSELGVELLSTGGTKKAIADASIPVKDVSEVTNFPEMMDGRVKTLHPVVHGGLLHLRDNDTHVAQAKEHGIEAIDLLYVNLYPFEETVAKGADFHTCIENIDIGGPAMLRAAAKNYAFVSVCTDGDDVDAVIADMETNNGATTLETRKKLMSSALDAAGTGSTSKGSTSITQIVQHVNPEPTSELEYAERIRADIEKISNPHLMVTILKVLQARMADIKKDYEGRS